VLAFKPRATNRRLPKIVCALGTLRRAA
jgi:hypothetical protein